MEDSFMGKKVLEVKDLVTTFRIDKFYKETHHF